MKKTGKKLLTLLLSLAMIVSMFTFTYADETVNVTEYSGQTAEGTYSISTAAQLTTLARTVNAGTNYEGSTFTLTADIDLSDDEWTPIGTASIDSDSNTGSPIVTSGTGFAGTLDGAGHTVSGMSITTARSGNGFIGYLAPAGTVENLILEGSIHITSSTLIDAVGGVAGYNSGTVSKVINRASVYAENGYNTGGIAGFNNGCYGTSPAGIIRQCGNEGTITGYSKIGGIAGENSGTITQCYNYATIRNLSGRKAGTGGITGRNGNNNTAVETGIITSCYNRGYVNNNNGYWGGGIAGFQNSLSSISNCYDTADTYHCGWSNPIVGKNESSLNGTNYSKTGLYHEENDTDSVGEQKNIGDMQGQSFAEILSGSYETAGWSCSVSVNNALPYFSWQTGSYTPAEANAADGITGDSSAPDLTGLSDSIVIDSRFTETGTDAAGNTRYNNLVSLLENVTSGTVYVTGPVVISEGTTATITNDITFVRYNTYTDGYMFEVNGTLNLQNGTISGNNLGCNAQVIVNTNGTLNMSGGVITAAEGIYRPGAGVCVCGGSFNMSGGSMTALTGTGTNTTAAAVDIEAGSLVLSGGTISGADDSSVVIYDNDSFVLNPASTTAVSGVVCLNNQTIMCGDSLAELSGTIRVMAANEISGTEIAENVSSSDVSRFVYYDQSCTLDYNGRSNVIFINSADNGSSLQLCSDAQLLDNINWLANNNKFTSDFTIPDGTIMNQAAIQGGTEDDPLIVTVEGTVQLKGQFAFSISAGSYVKFVGKNNAVFKDLSGSNNTTSVINLSSTGTVYVELDGIELSCDNISSQAVWLMSNANNTVVLEGGSAITGTLTASYGSAVYEQNGNVIINDAVLDPTAKGGTIYAEAGTVTVNNGTVINEGSSYNAIEGTVDLKFLPTGNVKVGKVSLSKADCISITPQEGYTISSYKLNGTDAAIPTAETSLGKSLTSLEIEVSEAPAAPTFEASLANVTAGPVAKGETFTADVVLTSDTVPASAALDLNVNSDVAKIVSITPAEGIGTTESTVATDGASGKVSFYGNTASAAEGLRVATVTFEAVADGTADISLTSEEAGVSGDPEDYDITVPESATEVIVKSPTVEAVDFGGSYQLVKYTPNAPIAEGMTVKYGDQEMYLADGSWYCVKADDEAPSLASVSVEEGTQTTYTTVAKGDVNENGKINIVDAQIAYDIANSVYTGFEQLSVTGVLKADANNNMAVDALDARAIQAYVHEGAFN